MRTDANAAAEPHVAVVIPCYNVAAHIVGVLQTIPALVRTIICVDDASPDDSAERIRRLANPRVVLVRHAQNQGVGGAMVTGYREALRRGADVVVKVDGDGQMDPASLPLLVDPLLRGKADYTKGNRWYHHGELGSMPAARRLGSVALSFLTKAVSGYWSIFDPCNGYTAIRASVLRQLPLEALARDYYFETSMLVELNILRALVVDVPMPARYGVEESSMRLTRVLRRFPLALMRSLVRRVWQRRFVRDFGPATLFLVSGLLLLGWGLGFGGWKWAESILTNTPATAGSVMLASLPFLMGFQLLLQVAVLEMNDQPVRALCHEEPLSTAAVGDELVSRAA
jgi:glycosyltransferase involved in cell wall biosynthesis